MANYRLIITILFVLLFFFSGYLFVSNANKADRLSQAEQLSGSTYRYLSKQDVRCSAQPTDFKKLNECVQKELKEVEKLDLEIDEFDDYAADENKSGYLILVNKGQESLDSNKFKLLKNREEADVGCAIQGSIDPGYTCKLHFNSTCETGDVLEVQYEGRRVADLKTC